MADAVTVDKIAGGDHACLTFTDPDERLDLVADFVASGLHVAQRVICFTESVTPEDLSAELALRDIAAGDASQHGQLMVRGSRAWWTPDGPAKSTQMITTIADELRRAASAGFSGLRVTADMCWAIRGTTAVDELIAFESKAARLFDDGGLIVFCQYDRDSFDPLTLAFAADTHPKAVAALAYHDTPLLRICRQHRPPGIRIAGEIDYTDIAPLQQALAEALRLDDPAVHVNLAKLRFIDVTAAATIAEAALTLPADRTMIVTCTESVAAVLDIVGAAQAPQMRILPEERMSPDDRFLSRPASGRPAHVDLDIGVDASSLYTLRAAVSAHASELGMSERQLDKLLVVATELATNVIRYGGSTGRLRLWRSADMLTCQVDDDGPGIMDVAQAGMQAVPLGAVGGRGLWIVRQLCNQVTITSDSHGVTVIATIAI